MVVVVVESVHERELFGGAFFRYCPQGVYYAGGVLTLMLYKVVQAFESANDNLKRDNLNQFILRKENTERKHPFTLKQRT